MNQEHLEPPNGRGLETDDGQDRQEQLLLPPVPVSADPLQAYLAEVRRIPLLTLEEARKIFDDLHQNADDWKKNGGDLEALERHRIASKAKGRRIFLRLARQRGLS